jgi:hypothetical protein
MRKVTMVDRDRRFFVRIPAGFFTMTEDEQQAATRAMWRETMVQMGEDPYRLVSENAKHECPDNQVQVRSTWSLGA